MKRLLQPWVVATLVAGSFLMRLPDGIGDGGLGGAKALALAPKAPAKTNASAKKKEPRKKVELTRVEPKTGMEFVRIPGGKSVHGCEASDTHCFDGEKPVRQVAVGSFWMAKTDATLAMYEKCVASGTCSAPITGGSCNWKVAGREQHPINCITWTQAKTFCDWAGSRLPTADEWEHAAKGGEGRMFPWGHDPVTATRANFCEKRCFQLHIDWTWTDRTIDDGWESTSPVGSYPQGASKHGLLDMAGNAQQWTSTDAPLGTKEARGGAWDVYPRYLRSSARVELLPTGWFDNVTVRCAQ